jgi:hypothetical protein
MKIAAGNAELPDVAPTLRRRVEHVEVTTHSSQAAQHSASQRPSVTHLIPRAIARILINQHATQFVNVHLIFV